MGNFGNVENTNFALLSVHTVFFYCRRHDCTLRSMHVRLLWLDFGRPLYGGVAVEENGISVGGSSQKVSRPTPAPPSVAHNRPKVSTRGGVEQNLRVQIVPGTGSCVKYAPPMCSSEPLRRCSKGDCEGEILTHDKTLAADVLRTSASCACIWIPFFVLFKLSFHRYIPEVHRYIQYNDMRAVGYSLEDSEKTPQR